MLEKLLDTVGKPFKKGGVLEGIWPAFDAADTFLMTPSRVTAGGPHVRDGIDLKRMMITVVVALFPCMLFGTFNIGYQSLLATGVEDPSKLDCFVQGAMYYLPIYAVTLFIGGHIEMFFAVARKHEINEGFLVSSALFPLVLPPTLPWWITAVAIFFGVFVGKEIFGGTGMNIFNPALLARCFIFFAYPSSIAGDKVWVASPIDSLTEFFFFPTEDKTGFVDGFSGATPLAHAATTTTAEDFWKAHDWEWMDMFLGLIPGSMGETSTLCCLIGAVILIATGIGSYKTMFGCLIGLGVTAGLLSLTLGGNESVPYILKMPPQEHLVMGGFAFGLVFMATDPVSSPATGLGKWIYGFLIGMFCVLIRGANQAYPEGMMLAILFMNLFAPLIDYYIIEAGNKRRLARV